MSKKVMFHIKNRKLMLLVLVDGISVGAATYIQFVKGNMFEQAARHHGQQLLFYLLLFLVVMCIEVSFYYVEWRYENYLLTSTFYKLKKGIANKVLVFSKNNRKPATEDATQLLTNSIDSLSFPYYSAWFSNIYLVLRIVFVSVSLFMLNVWLTLLLFVLMLFPLLLTQLFKNKLAILNKKYLDKTGENLHKYENMMTNLTTIHIFDLHRYVMNRLDKSLKQERDYRQESNNYQYLLNVSYSFLSYFSSFVVLLFSLVLVSQGKITLGTTITLLGLVEQLSMPILSLSRNTSNINSTKKVRSDIDDVYAAKLEPRRKLSFQKQISVRDLHVRVDGKDMAYQNLEFVRGKSYLIRGRSGIGKSVFLKAIMGLQEFNQGNISYDNEVLAKNKTDNVFQDLCYVQADNALFEDTVLANIFFDKKPTEGELEKCRQLLADDVLSEKDTNKLSTGEKRRVLVLRGLMAAKDKSVLVFDEPTANLDATTSSLFWRMLFSWFKESGKTLIVVSHTIDPANLAKFDKQIDFNEAVS